MHPILKHVRLAVWLILVGILLFFTMGLSVSSKAFFSSFDRTVIDGLRQLEQNWPAWIINAIRTYSLYLDYITMAGGFIAAVYFIFKKEWRNFFLVLFVLGGTQLIWLSLVFSIDRPRPHVVYAFTNHVSLPGFPSGHAMLAVPIWGLTAYILIPKLKSHFWKTVTWVVALLIALSAGLSRLIVRAHYPSDVIAGYALGVTWTTLAILMVEWYFASRENKSENLQKEKD